MLGFSVRAKLARPHAYRGLSSLPGRCSCATMGDGCSAVSFAEVEMRSVRTTKQKSTALPSLIQVARQVKRNGQARVISSGGSPLAAVVPLPEYRLTRAIVRKLEDEEDAARTRAALADTDPKSWSSLDDIRKELGLEPRGPQVRKKGAAQIATKSRRKTARRR